MGSQDSLTDVSSRKKEKGGIFSSLRKPKNKDRKGSAASLNKSKDDMYVESSPGKGKKGLFGRKKKEESPPEGATEKSSPGGVSKSSSKADIVVEGEDEEEKAAAAKSKKGFFSFGSRRKKKERGEIEGDVDLNESTESALKDASASYEKQIKEQQREAAKSEREWKELEAKQQEMQAKIDAVTRKHRLSQIEDEDEEAELQQALAAHKREQQAIAADKRVLQASGYAPPERSTNQSSDQKVTDLLAQQMAQEAQRAAEARQVAAEKRAAKALERQQEEERQREQEAQEQQQLEERQQRQRVKAEKEGKRSTPATYSFEKQLKAQQKALEDEKKALAERQETLAAKERSLAKHRHVIEQSNDRQAQAALQRALAEHRQQKEALKAQQQAYEERRQEQEKRLSGISQNEALVSQMFSEAQRGEQQTAGDDVPSEISQTALARALAAQSEDPSSAPFSFEKELKAQQEAYVQQQRAIEEQRKVLDEEERQLVRQQRHLDRDEEEDEEAQSALQQALAEHRAKKQALQQQKVELEEKHRAQQKRAALIQQQQAVEAAKGATAQRQAQRERRRAQEGIAAGSGDAMQWARRRPDAAVAAGEQEPTSPTDPSVPFSIERVLKDQQESYAHEEQEIQARRDQIEAEERQQARQQRAAEAAQDRAASLELQRALAAHKKEKEALVAQQEVLEVKKAQQKRWAEETAANQDLVAEMFAQQVRQLDQPKKPQPAPRKQPTAAERAEVTTTFDADGSIEVEASTASAPYSFEKLLKAKQAAYAREQEELEQQARVLERQEQALRRGEKEAEASSDQQVQQQLQHAIAKQRKEREALRAKQQEVARKRKVQAELAATAAAADQHLLTQMWADQLQQEVVKVRQHGGKPPKGDKERRRGASSNLEPTDDASAASGPSFEKLLKVKQEEYANQLQVIQTRQKEIDNQERMLLEAQKEADLSRDREAQDELQAALAEQRRHKVAVAAQQRALLEKQKRTEQFAAGQVSEQELVGQLWAEVVQDEAKKQRHSKTKPVAAPRASKSSTSDIQGEAASAAAAAPYSFEKALKARQDEYKRQDTTIRQRQRDLDAKHRMLLKKQRQAELTDDLQAQQELKQALAEQAREKQAIQKQQESLQEKRLAQEKLTKALSTDKDLVSQLWADQVSQEVGQVQKKRRRGVQPVIVQRALLETIEDVPEPASGAASGVSFEKLLKAKQQEYSQAQQELEQRRQATQARESELLAKQRAAEESDDRIAMTMLQRALQEQIQEKQAVQLQQERLARKLKSKEKLAAAISSDEKLVAEIWAEMVEEESNRGTQKRAASRENLLQAASSSERLFDAGVTAPFSLEKLLKAKQKECQQQQSSLQEESRELEARERVLAMQLRQAEDINDRAAQKELQQALAEQTRQKKLLQRNQENYEKKRSAQDKLAKAMITNKDLVSQLWAEQIQEEVEKVQTTGVLPKMSVAEESDEEPETAEDVEPTAPSFEKILKARQREYAATQEALKTQQQEAEEEERSLVVQQKEAEKARDKQAQMKLQIAIAEQRRLKESLKSQQRTVAEKLQEKEKQAVTVAADQETVSQLWTHMLREEASRVSDANVKAAQQTNATAAEKRTLQEASVPFSFEKLLKSKQAEKLDELKKLQREQRGIQGKERALTLQLKMAEAAKDKEAQKELQNAIAEHKRNKEELQQKEQAIVQVRNLQEKMAEAAQLDQAQVAAMWSEQVQQQAAHKSGVKPRKTKKTPGSPSREDQSVGPSGPSFEKLLKERQRQYVQQQEALKVQEESLRSQERILNERQKEAEASNDRMAQRELQQAIAKHQKEKANLRAEQQAVSSRLQAQAQFENDTSSDLDLISSLWSELLGKETVRIVTEEPGASTMASKKEAAVGTGAVFSLEELLKAKEAQYARQEEEVEDRLREIEEKMETLEEEAEEVEDRRIQKDLQRALAEQQNLRQAVMAEKMKLMEKRNAQEKLALALAADEGIVAELWAEQVQEKVHQKEKSSGAAPAKSVSFGDVQVKPYISPDQSFEKTLKQRKQQYAREAEALQAQQQLLEQQEKALVEKCRRAELDQDRQAQAELRSALGAHRQQKVAIQTQQQEVVEKQRAQERFASSLANDSEVVGDMWAELLGQETARVVIETPEDQLGGDEETSEGAASSLEKLIIGKQEDLSRQQRLVHKRLKDIAVREAELAEEVNQESDRRVQQKLQEALTEQRRLKQKAQAEQHDLAEKQKAHARLAAVLTEDADLVAKVWAEQVQQEQSKSSPVHGGARPKTTVSSPTASPAKAAAAAAHAPSFEKLLKAKLAEYDQEQTALADKLQQLDANEKSYIRQKRGADVAGDQHLQERLQVALAEARQEKEMVKAQQQAVNEKYQGQQKLLAAAVSDGDLMAEMWSELLEEEAVRLQEPKVVEKPAAAAALDPVQKVLRAQEEIIENQQEAYREKQKEMEEEERILVHAHDAAAAAGDRPAQRELAAALEEHRHRRQALRDQQLELEEKRVAARKAAGAIIKKEPPKPAPKPKLAPKPDRYSAVPKLQQKQTEKAEPLPDVGDLKEKLKFIEQDKKNLAEKRRILEAQERVFTKQKMQARKNRDKKARDSALSSLQGVEVQKESLDYEEEELLLKQQSIEKAIADVKVGRRPTSLTPQSSPKKVQAAVAPKATQASTPGAASPGAAVQEKPSPGGEEDDAKLLDLEEKALRANLKDLERQARVLDKQHEAFEGSGDIETQRELKAALRKHRHEVAAVKAELRKVETMKKQREHEERTQEGATQAAGAASQSQPSTQTTPTSPPPAAAPAPAQNGASGSSTLPQSFSPYSFQKLLDAEHKAYQKAKQILSKKRRELEAQYRVIEKKEDYLEDVEDPEVARELRHEKAEHKRNKELLISHEQAVEDRRQRVNKLSEMAESGELTQEMWADIMGPVPGSRPPQARRRPQAQPTPAPAAKEETATEARTYDDYLKLKTNETHKMMAKEQLELERQQLMNRRIEKKLKEEEDRLERERIDLEEKAAQAELQRALEKDRAIKKAMEDQIEREEQEEEEMRKAQERAAAEKAAAVEAAREMLAAKREAEARRAAELAAEARDAPPSPVTPKPSPVRRSPRRPAPAPEEPKPEPFPFEENKVKEKVREEVRKALEDKHRALDEQRKQLEEKQKEIESKKRELQQKRNVQRVIEDQEAQEALQRALRERRQARKKATSLEEDSRLISDMWGERLDLESQKAYEDSGIPGSPAGLDTIMSSGLESDADDEETRTKKRRLLGLFGKDRSKKQASAILEEREQFMQRMESNTPRPTPLPTPQEIRKMETDKFLQWKERNTPQGTPLSTPVPQKRKTVRVKPPTPWISKYAKKRIPEFLKGKDRKSRMSSTGSVSDADFSLAAKIWVDKYEQELTDMSGDEGTRKLRRSMLSRSAEDLMSDSDVNSSVRVFARGQTMSDTEGIFRRSNINRKKMAKKKKNKYRDAHSDNELLSDREGAFSDFSAPEMSGDEGTRTKKSFLFFKLGYNWKELAVALFHGLLTVLETNYIIQEIEEHYPKNLTKQVNAVMHKWWKVRGPEATLEELELALEMVHLGYVKDNVMDMYEYHQSRLYAASGIDWDILSDYEAGCFENFWDSSSLFDSTWSLYYPYSDAETRTSIGVIKPVIPKNRPDVSIQHHCCSNPTSVLARI